MNVKKLLTLGAALAFVTVATSDAQSLSDLAKQEKQRRAKAKTTGGTPAKVYTDDGGTVTTTSTTTTTAAGAASTTAADPAPAAGGKKEKTREEQAAEAQAAWTKQLTETNAEIAELEKVIANNQANLDSMINVTPARANLASRVDADRAKVAQLRQKLLDLEEQRRRAGMPRVR
jgi:hypothetical protein